MSEVLFDETPIVCKHYAEIDGQGNIVSLWNDAIQPWRLGITPSAVLLGEWEGTEIRLSPDGEADPSLADMDLLYFYKWDGLQTRKKTEEELAAERAALPHVPAAPTTTQRLATLEEALAQTDETAIALYEAQAAQEAINAAQDEALIELYELMEV